jgi:hypothetical protein
MQPGTNPNTINPIGNAGLLRYPDRVDNIFKAPDAQMNIRTLEVEIAPGQVLRARTLLEQDPFSGLARAKGAIQQSWQVAFTPDATTGFQMNPGDSITIAGVVFTASTQLGPRDVVDAFIAFGNALVENSTIYGSLTASQLTSSLAVAGGTFAYGSMLMENGAPAYTFREVPENVILFAVGTLGTEVLEISTNFYYAPNLTGVTLSQSIASLASTTALTSKAQGGKIYLQLNGALASTQTFSAFGLTFTATAAATAANIAASFLTGAGVNGNMTGTNQGWLFSSLDQTGNGLIVASQDPTTLAVANQSPVFSSSNATLSYNVTYQYDIPGLIGILAQDVNTLTGTYANMVCESQMYVEGNFYWNALKWENVPPPASGNGIFVPQGVGVFNEFNSVNGYDYVVNAGTDITPCTAYWTGVTSYKDAREIFRNATGNTYLRLSNFLAGEYPLT